MTAHKRRGILDDRPLEYLFNSLLGENQFGLQSPSGEKPPVTGGFSSQRTSNAQTSPYHDIIVTVKAETWWCIGIKISNEWSFHEDSSNLCSCRADSKFAPSQ